LRLVEMRLRSREGAAKGPITHTKSASEAETETETETEAEADGYLADDHPPRKDAPRKDAPRQAGTTKIGADENFENLQATSKWFPNAYKGPKPSDSEQSPEQIALQKRKEFWVRTRWTFAMFIGFLFCIASGQIYVMSLVVAIKMGMFKEILSLKRNREKDKRIPWFRVLNWYFFAVCIYFVYGRILVHHIQVVHLEHDYVGFITDHHLLKSFGLWIIGFCTFILSLEKGTYKYQFSQFGWTHITLLMVVISASSMVHNMYAGMVWFFVPVCLVIWNDVYAYVFGRFWGKTPLIKLSPKKTWEGFFGALVTTLVFGQWACGLTPYFEYMICPQEELTIVPFSKVDCTLNPAFVPSIPLPMPILFRRAAREMGFSDPGDHMLIMPFMIHGFFLSLFAALVRVDPIANSASKLAHLRARLVMCTTDLQNLLCLWPLA